jgi:hypothetical protein
MFSRPRSDGLGLHSYFVEDGNHRVSVARYQGVETIEADVIEIFPLYGAHQERTA